MQNSTKNSRLLIFANDPAGANVTMAYAKLFKNNYSQILAYCTKTSKVIYQDHIPEYIANIKNLYFKQSDTIITGSSGIDSSFELNIIKKAHKHNVKKTIMIVDSTSNFLMRFKIDNKLIEEKYIPNEIWIFEKYFKSNIDFIDKRLYFKENYYVSYIKQLFKNNPPVTTNKFINKYKYNYITILSEYVYELYRLKYGFTEYEVVELILEYINKYNKNIPIYLKLHPKEHKNKYNILLRKYDNLIINNLQEINIQELIYYSKIVFGINSSVFNESNLFSIPSYSIQINRNYPLNTSASNTINNKQELIDLIINIK